MMRKIYLSIILLGGFCYSYSNNIVNYINAYLHGQIYCIKGDESKEVRDFLKDHAKYSFNECKLKKYSDKDFKELEELVNKNPKKYSDILGMAYFLGIIKDHKEDVGKARQYYQESIKLGNKKSKLYYCDTISDAKKAFDCYMELKTNDSYLAIAGLFIGIKKQCQYLKEIDNNKFLDVYPMIISCKSSMDEKFHLSKNMGKKLEKVLLDDKTTFISKFMSADYLQDEKYLSILSEIQFKQ